VSDPVRTRAAFRGLVRAYTRMSFRGRASQAFAGQLAGRPLGVLWLLGMYAAIGATTIPALLASPDAFTYALVTQVTTWTLGGLILIAEAGDALFHPSEREVVGHRPVDAGLVLAAKVLVLYLFVSMIALALNLVPLVVMLVRGEVGRAVAHLVAVAGSVAVATALVTVAYGLAARFVSRDRFDDVAGWSQVMLAFAFVVLANALTRSGIRSGLRIDPATPLLLGVPPAWFAGLEVAITEGRATVLAALALASLVALWALVRAAVFTRMATALARVDLERAARVVRPVRALEGWLVRQWVRAPVERGSFYLALAYLRRDRDTRLRLRPSLAMFTLLPLAGLVLKPSEGGHLVPLATACMLGMIPGVALEALRISSTPQAAGLFGTAPIADPGEIFHGVRKATLYFVLPAFAGATVLAGLIVPDGLPLALPGVIALPLFALLPGLFGGYVPLSRPKARGQQASANAILLIVSTLVLAILVAETLRASRTGRLPLFCAGEALIVLTIDRGLRRWIRWRGLTSSGGSPTYDLR